MSYDADWFGDFGVCGGFAGELVDDGLCEDVEQVEEE